MELEKIKVDDIMANIVPIYKNKYGDKFINARDLHKSLGIKKDFSNWIKGCLKKYNVTDSNEKYNPFANQCEWDYEWDAYKVDLKLSKYSSKRIEYILTLDVGKEIAIMSRTNKGQNIRKYFIKTEKELIEILDCYKDVRLSSGNYVELLQKTKEELKKANKSKEYNKKINDELRKEIKELKKEIEKAKENPIENKDKIKMLEAELDIAFKEAEYWEGAYNSTIKKLDNKTKQVNSLLSIKIDYKQYFNSLTKKHAENMIYKDKQQNLVKANTFRKYSIMKNKEICYVKNSNSSFLDTIHVKSIPLALETYINALKEQLGNNFIKVIGKDLINEIESTLKGSKITLNDVDKNVQQLKLIPY